MSDALLQNHAQEINLLKKMKFEEKAKLIRDSITYITKDDLNCIKNLLFESQLINFDEMTELEKKEIKSWPTLILDSKNEKKYDKYIEAIIDKKEIKKLLEKLTSEEDQTKGPLISTDGKDITCHPDPVQNAGKPYDWFYQDYQDLENTVLTQADASRLSACFGGHWQDVMMQLGLKKNVIDLELQNVGYNPQRAISCLIIKWIQRNGRNATFMKFIEALKELQESRFETIDWKQVQKVLNKRRSS